MRVVEKVTRRSFLRSAGLGTGALVLGAHVGPGGMAKALFGMGHEGALELNTFVSIKRDGTVILMTHRSEMGQGIKTTLPAIVADELEADWSKVVVQQAIGDAKYGNQWTDGSRSVTLFFQTMREMGATARHMLLDAAAHKFRVDIGELQASNHRVTHAASGQSAGYGELVERAAKLRVPPVEDVRLKTPAEWKYIGKAMPFWDLDDMVTGRAVYGADVAADNTPELAGVKIKTAMIVRSPRDGARVQSFDPAATLAMPGVEKVMEVKCQGGLGAKFQPLPGVAVIAKDTWSAWLARRKLENAIQWTDGPHTGYESQSYRDELEAASGKQGKIVRDRGDVDAALAGGDTHEAGYYVPHLCQAQMEPLVATAVLKGNQLHVWAPTQSPQAAQEVIEQVLGLPHTTEHKKSAYEAAAKGVVQVTVHVTLLGGGFGRKSKPDFVCEAAWLAYHNPGTAIRVQWTREDDMRHGYYNACCHQRVKAALGPDGMPTAWRQRSAFPTFMATIGDASTEYAGHIELGQGLLDLPYDIPNIRLENCPAKAHTRIGWLRSVANIFHAFAISSFTDELAHKAGRDPKDYLIDLIGPGGILDVDAEIEVSEAKGVEAYDNYGASKTDFPVDTARLRGVIERVAQESGWGREMPAGRGLGIAAHRSFLSYVATVIDVTVDGKNLAVNEVWIVIDCGLAVNPERVHAQLEGGVIYALGVAIHDDVTFSGGVPEQWNYDDYPTLRLNQSPDKIHTAIVESDGPPGGVGEPPVPPVAPALTNAIFAASGERIRDLPLWRLGYKV